MSLYPNIFSMGYPTSVPNVMLLSWNDQYSTMSAGLIDNQVINEPFTEIKVKKAIKTLKSNKCGGIDSSLNEFIKSSPDIIIEIIVKLFNIILDSELIPTDWCLVMIKPI